MLDDREPLDASFREAVSAIDVGDIASLERFIAANPALVRDRLLAPGAWLRDVVGKAVDGFFRQPYLLWFVAEDPVRNGRLPGNIAEVASVIIAAARREESVNLQEQLDYTLTLTSWSWIARQCGVQIGLIDALIDGGASPDGNPDNALVNGNIDAAEHLVKRGAKLTLATALCLGRWDDVDRLLPTSTPGQQQFGLVLSALGGRADALRRMVRAGVDLDAPSEDLYSHGTPLHHAASSGSLEAVRVLVDAGADVSAKDTAWGGTALGWAHHYIDEATRGGPPREYAAIAEYLRSHASNS